MTNFDPTKFNAIPIDTSFNPSNFGAVPVGTATNPLDGFGIASSIKELKPKNTAQSALGIFLDPIIKTGVKAGEAVGEAALTGINKITGGKLDKYTPEGDLGKALDRAGNTPGRVPIIGTEKQPTKDITAKNTVGEAISTVALGLPGATAAGGALGLGHALETDKGAIGTAVETVASAVGGKILEYGFTAVAPYLEKAALKYGEPFLEKVAQYIPESAKGFMDNLSSKIVPVVEKETPSIIDRASSKVAEVVEKPFDYLGEKATQIKSKFSPKTKEKILSTPEDKVYKLSAPERKLYFDTKTEEITRKSAEMEARVQTEMKVAADAAQVQAEGLHRDLAVASRDEVLKLRPKIVKAMGEQSKTYRRLVAEEMAGKEEVPVYLDDLRTHVDSRYADNPALANAIKEKLGITDIQPVTLKKGQVPTIQTDGGKTTTLGKLFDKTKALKQDISVGATKGIKSFTPEDKMTDDAINTLVDFMKSNGVDFKAANQFWSRYAPIRNQLVTEAKPFLQTGTQTKTFANTLTRVAGGKDVNNEIFINEVENLLGESIANETKLALSKLSSAEKQALAQKVEAEAQKVEIQLTKQKELKKLSDTQFKAEQKAWRRKIIRNIILVGGGITGIGSKVVNAAGI